MHPPVLAPVCLLLGIACCQGPASNPSEGDSQSSTQLHSQALVPSFVSLFDKTSRSVVNVSAAHPLPIPEQRLPGAENEFLRTMVRSLGSGFVFDKQGHLITCSSVVQNAKEIKVILANGQHIKARLVGSDEVSDLAVLSIPPQLAPPPLLLGSSKELRVGDWVAAFGYPFGLSHTMSAGIVSAIRTAEEMKSSHGLILSDASINPGCNGGPLLDTSGKVVGINQIIGQPEGGMGLAIPMEDALLLVKLLKSGRQPQRPRLGISVQQMDARLAASFGLTQTEGALVSRVKLGSSAAKAGISRGDLIVSFAGRPVKGPLALIHAVRASALGKRIEVQIIRQGKRKTLTLVLQATSP